MSVSPSELQRRASDPSSSAWVAASAGSGKTKVLTDRVLRLLLAGASPSKVLCITYTKAAAAEMQNRLHTRLGEWVVMEGGELKDELKALGGLEGEPPREMVRNARRLFALLLEDAPGLRIQTFHSFCQSLLARFPLEAGVAPHFTLIEEQEARDLLEEARQRLLQNALMRTDTRLSEAVEEMIAELGEMGFGEMLEKIVVRRREVEHVLSVRGWAVAHNTRVYEVLGLPCYGITEEELLADILPLGETRRQRIALLVDVLEGGSAQDKNMAGKLRVFTLSGAREDLMQALLTQKGTAASRLMTVKLQQTYPDHYALIDRLARECEAANAQLAALGIARFSDATAIVAESLFALYAAMKRARGYLDYDDLILKTRALLRGEGMAKWVLYKIDGGIDHLLIDEAQDTSPEQWELKEVLEDEFFAGKGASQEPRTLFVVGDEKQSIYSFQGADPAGFLSQKQRTRQRTAESGDAFEDVPMHTSFRSAPAVLAAVDAVFTEGEGHIPYRAGASGKVELWPLTHWADTEGEEETWPVPERRRESASPEMQLALRMAETIAEKTRSGVWGAGDILVLVRSRGDFIHFLSRALKDRGVPVAGLDRMKFTEHLAVRDLMALAQFLLLPEDDYTLACLLKSPLFALSEERLFALCHGRGQVSLWERLRADDTCRPMLEELEVLLARADWGSPYALFSELLYARGGRQRFMARMGEEVEEVLEVFLSLALDYERIRPPTLQGFLEWLAHGAGEIKRDMEQGVDAVRIMTVHGAKGLEAPVVFLADKTYPQPLRERLYFLSLDSGNVMLCSPRSEADDVVVARLRDERRAQEAAESLRLLYVAMTRARDELYVTGWQGGDRNVPEDCWHRRVETALQGMPEVEATEEGGLVLMHKGKEEALSRAAPCAGGALSLPDYAHAVPPLETSQTAVLAPSHLDETDSGNKRGAPGMGGMQAERGRLVHRLLQILIGIEEKVRATVAEGYLASHAAQWSHDERRSLAEEVLSVMRHPDFAAVFAPGALAEAPIIGRVGEQRIAGQIDLLAVGKDEVLAVDFKTGQVPEDGCIPAPYIRQMQAYGALLGAIYPGRKIRLALLYISGPKIVPIA